MWHVHVVGLMAHRQCMHVSGLVALCEVVPFGIWLHLLLFMLSYASTLERIHRKDSMGLRKPFFHVLFFFCFSYFAASVFCFSSLSGTRSVLRT